MKKVVLLSMFAVFALAEIAPVSAAGALTLFGTKWKLEGFFSAETNELRQPKMDGSAPNLDRNDPFTLEFSQDSIVRHEAGEYRTCNGKLAYSTFWGLYTADYFNSTIGFEVLIRPNMRSDSGDGEKYDRALYLSRRFELKDIHLKIYYGDDMDYLLFKPWGKTEAISVESVASRTKAGVGAAVAVTDIVLSKESIAAGPNPVVKSAGHVDFYRMGKHVKNASLKIYDVSGRVICLINIRDSAASGDVQSQFKRRVGSWNLKDAKGRPVSEGSYLVKGTIKTVEKKTEKITLLINVR